MQKLRIKSEESKTQLTIIVTDSGIGGIAVAAELYRALKDHAAYEHVRIVYFNALFDEQSGYHILKSMSQKTAIFDTALHGMLRYAPDVILLASNTLSVLYPYTSFSKSDMLPVVGLIELGVNHILKRVRSDANSGLIVFATPITVREGIFRKMLAPHIAENRIVEQACQGLEYAIGDGEQATVRRLIHEYVGQAIQQLSPEIGDVYASLNCTHFGYYQGEFLQAFQDRGFHTVKILNPNEEMVKLFTPEDCPSTDQPEVTLEFVSKVRFHPQGIRSLMPFLKAISEDVVSALQEYQYNPQLF